MGGITKHLQICDIDWGQIRLSLFNHALKIGASEVDGVEPIRSTSGGTRAKGCSNEEFGGGGGPDEGLAPPVTVEYRGQRWPSPPAE